MDREALDRVLREQTRGAVGLTSVVHTYLDGIRRAASVLGVPVEQARVREDRAEIELTVTEAPDVVIRWAPAAGWFFEYEREGRRAVKYWAGQEWDAASIMVEAESVAAWLAVLARGSREGHDTPPEELDPRDPAMVDRMLTLGVGRDPYAPF